MRTGSESGRKVAVDRQTRGREASMGQRWNVAESPTSQEASTLHVQGHFACSLCKRLLRFAITVRFGQITIISCGWALAAAIQRTFYNLYTCILLHPDCATTNKKAPSDLTDWSWYRTRVRNILRQPSFNLKTQTSVNSPKPTKGKASSVSHIINRSIRWSREPITLAAVEKCCNS